MSRILVTGGAGFIGSHLVERLLLEGHEVICLDNFDTGTKQSLMHVKDHPFLEIWRHDVCQPIVCEVDQIYHLACPASPAYYLEHPVKTIETCVLGAYNVFQLALKCDAPVFLASTSEVYGDPACHPQVESYWGNVNPIGPRSCYDEGKRASESMAMAYHREYGLKVRLARIFNSYGPRMRVNDGRVVSNFMMEALQDQPMVIYGSGQQTRSFCYINDTVEAMIRWMSLPEIETAPGFIGPMNIGNPEEVTIIELAHYIKQLTVSQSEISFADPLEDDPIHRCPDISLAKTMLQWEPGFTLKEGLALTVDYFRNQVAALSAPPSLVWSVDF